MMASAPALAGPECAGSRLSFSRFNASRLFIPCFIYCSNLRSVFSLVIPTRFHAFWDSNQFERAFPPHAHIPPPMGGSDEPLPTDALAAEKVLAELGTPRPEHVPMRLREGDGTGGRGGALLAISTTKPSTRAAAEAAKRFAAYAVDSTLSCAQLAALLSDESENALLDPSEAAALTQPMDAPLSCYWINTSHNTYLEGDQLASESTTAIYARVLLLGCRCLELDMWDGPEGGEPMITHGHTSCTCVGLREVCEAIGKVSLPGDAFSSMRIVPPDGVINGVRVKGRPSLTRWRVLERLERRDSAITRVALEPVTGRAHQLRLHMEAVGHPLLGDQLHGGAAAAALAPRLCLHAVRLEFTHPDPSHEELVVAECPAPF